MAFHRTLNVVIVSQNPPSHVFNFLCFQNWTPPSLREKKKTTNSSILPLIFSFSFSFIPSSYSPQNNKKQRTLKSNQNHNIHLLYSFSLQSIQFFTMNQRVPSSQTVRIGRVKPHLVIAPFSVMIINLIIIFDSRFAPSISSHCTFPILLPTKFS